MFAFRFTRFSLTFSSKTPVKIQFFLSHFTFVLSICSQSHNICECFLYFDDPSRLLNFGGLDVKSQRFIKPFRCFMWLWTVKQIMRSLTSHRSIASDTSSVLQQRLMEVFYWQTNPFVVHQQSINVIFAFSVRYFSLKDKRPWPTLEPTLWLHKCNNTTHRISCCRI